MFAFKNSKFDRLSLMHKGSSAPESYEDCIRAVGSLNKPVIENSQVLTGTKWTNISRRYFIDTGLTVPKHQHQNYCEQVGGNVKFSVLKLFHNTPHAPVSYWYYAASFLDKTRRYISHPSIGNRSGYEVIKGETGDISIFRFYWFEPIWFYNPQSSFSKDKMEPCFFLDLADNTGDNFSYVVLPVKDRSNIPLYRRPVTLV